MGRNYACSKTYLKENKFKKTAFFITFAAAAEDAAYQMEKLSKKTKSSLRTPR